MTKRKLVSAAIGLWLSGTTALAGGILTNTNQSIDFLINPARNAAIGLDGVYSNPAGVVFMPQGFHLGINWQIAHQTRTITSTNPLFALGKRNDGSNTKTFEGVADARCVPSVQMAYNTGNWSFQFNFSMPGGGGICEFENGIGSFESAVGLIAKELSPLGAEGYDANVYVRGRQYYFGFQLGAAYKINEHWSVYGGLRALYGDASYKARMTNIQVKMTNPGGEPYYVDFDQFLNSSIADINKKLGQAELAYQMGMYTQEQYMAVKAQADAVLGQLDPLEKYGHGVNLMSIQTGFGVAPIIGVDYRTGAFNFAAKYEFKTRMKMKNHSTLDKATEIEALNKFKDGTEVDEDAPALLSVGAQWSIIPSVRANIGYHHYFDKSAHWYKHAEKNLGGDTNEYLFGAEWDINKRITVGSGMQFTRYDLTDEYMNDMSFVVNSYSFGLGLKYNISDHVRVKAAYFQTNYEDYDKVTQTNPATGAVVIGDTFTRTNKVFGLGVDVTL